MIRAKIPEMIVAGPKARKRGVAAPRDVVVVVVDKDEVGYVVEVMLVVVVEDDAFVPNALA